MKKTFYVTTPIYYPNDIPHVGHGYTTIAADVLARWKRLQGTDVLFLTGTDEHGKKIERAAEKVHQTPQTFVNHLVPEFKEAWKKLNIGYDRFIRTTDSDHEQVVQVLLAEAHKKGDIYEGYYEGLYCTGCEAYYTEKDLKEGCCPIHGTKIETVKEESYFFKLSTYQKKLLDYYKKNPDFIAPENKRKEIINRVQEGLQDLSISRTNFKWGIPVPFDKEHVTYVWFDALSNYLTGAEYLKNQKKFKQYWPADIHIIGKDILWFHAVIWPAMLLSLGLPLPKKIFAHGWWTFNNEKISKSKGKVINIAELVGIAGVDAARYFLLRETPFGQDGDFSEQALIERHNNELANKLGNLISRVSTLAETYGLTKTKPLQTKKLIASVTNHLDTLAFDKALNEIFAFIDTLNELVQEKKPWETHDKKLIYQLADGIKTSAILLAPFLPETAEKIASVFHFDITMKDLKTPLAVTKVKKAPILFHKIDMVPKKETSTKKLTETKKQTVEKAKPTAQPIKATNTEKISYDDFSKVQLKVGKITEVKPHPNADKLYVLTVDLGEEKARTIVAGLRNHYQPEHLKGKKAIFAANLAPVTIRGVESNGMILAAVNEDDSHVTILIPDEDIAVGSKIR